MRTVIGITFTFLLITTSIILASPLKVNVDNLYASSLPLNNVQVTLYQPEKIASPTPTLLPTPIPTSLPIPSSETIFEKSSVIEGSNNTEITEVQSEQTTIPVIQIEQENSVDNYSELINKVRKENGLPGYTESETTCQVAESRVEEIVNGFNHLNLQSYTDLYGTIFGENLAVGYKTSAEVINAWMNSKIHTENILSTQWHHVCVKSQDTYVVAIFSE